MPVLDNLYGTPLRVRSAGKDEWRSAETALLAVLKEPEPPRGWGDLWDKLPLVKRVFSMVPTVVSGAPCQEVIREAGEVNLSDLPIQTCWPGDVAPLITWGLVVTRGPHKRRQNFGIYRQQVVAKNKVIMRWLIARAARSITATTVSPSAEPFRSRLRSAPTPHPARRVTRCRTACPIPILGRFARAIAPRIVKCLSHVYDVPARAGNRLGFFLPV